MGGGSQLCCGVGVTCEKPGSHLPIDLSRPVWLLQGSIWPWFPALVQPYSPSLGAVGPCPTPVVSLSCWTCHDPQLLVTSLTGPLALPALWHTQPSAILAWILSPTAIKWLWSCMMIHLWSSTETQKIAEHAWYVKCLLLIQNRLEESEPFDYNVLLTFQLILMQSQCSIENNVPGTR